LKDGDFDFFPKISCVQITNPFSLWQSSKNLTQKKNLAEIFYNEKIKCWDLSMNEGVLFVLFVCHVEISQAMAPLAMFLVLLLESSQ